MYSETLLKLATAYSEARGLSLATVGTYAVNDGSFFKRLAEGRVTIRRAEEAVRWLSDHWPADLDWSPEIPRPPANRKQDAA